MKWTKKKYLLIGIAIFVILSLSFLVIWHYNYKDVSMEAKNGFLDLSQYSFKKNNGPVKLNGEWELYKKNQLLTSEDFAKDQHVNRQLQRVPGTFTIDKHKKGEYGFGYGTYRLRVKTNTREKILGLKLLTMSTSYSLAVDDAVIATNGQVATSKDAYESEYKPQVVIFEPEENTFDIIVQVANYTYNRIGIWHSIIIGEHEQVLRLREESIKRTMFFLLGGILFFMLLYQIGIYFFYIDIVKNKYHAYY